MTDIFETTFFEAAFFWEVQPYLLRGFEVTVKASILGFILAAILGLIFAILRRSERWWIHYPVVWFLEVVWSTPFLVQLFFVFFILPQYGVTFEPFTIGVLMLGVHYSTYTAEVYRAGIEGVPSGQWEASVALNYRPLDRWRRVILPQAVPPVVPVLGNYLITIFKETPLLASITVTEVLHEARLIGSDRFQFLEPMTGCGLYFLIISLISAMGVRWLDKYLRTRKGGLHGAYG